MQLNSPAEMQVSFFIFKKNIKDIKKEEKKAGRFEMKNWIKIVFCFLPLKPCYSGAFQKVFFFQFLLYINFLNFLKPFLMSEFAGLHSWRTFPLRMQVFF